jgi:general L-amino acid transport system substrate-binding protein
LPSHKAVRFFGAIMAALGILAGGVTAAKADTLADVKARGAVNCAASTAPDFAATEVNGAWSGIGVDYCRALAAVIFNDPGKVRFVPTAPDGLEAALRTRTVDALAVFLPWSLASDDDKSLRFVATMVYDGQGFLAPKAAALRSARDLAAKTVCTVETGAMADAAVEYFDANNIQAEVSRQPNTDAALAAYAAGSCLAITASDTELALLRSHLPNPADHVLLPDLISKEPLAIAIAANDDRWFDVVRWTFYALLDAEELSVTQSNVDELLGTDNISIRRFLGVEGDFGAQIGLNKDWAYQLIKGVGNYSDIYERNVGEQTPLKLPRGLNALWNKGGVQYAPPVR